MFPQFVEICDWLNVFVKSSLMGHKSSVLNQLMTDGAVWVLAMARALHCIAFLIKTLY